MSNQKMTYDYTECRRLALNCPRNDNDFTDACKYYYERVFKTREGSILFYNDGELKRTSIDDFKKVKMDGFPAKFVEKLKQTSVEYDEVLEKEDYIVDFEKKKINSMPRCYGATLKDVKVTKKGKKYVDFVLKFLKEIISDNDEEFYNYLLKKCAKIVRLEKDDTILVFVTRSEGVGKTSVAKILGSILGNGLYFPADKSHFLTKNNLALYGKTLVLLEETQGLSGQDHANLMDKLKNMTTEDKWNYGEMYMKAECLPCISNFMVTSNFEVNIDGRRAVNKRISTKWLGEFDKWEELYDFCDENIKALYDYFMSIDVKGFRGQKEAMKLKSNDDNQILKSIENLSSAWEYMREEYALQKKTLKIKQSDLYEEYKEAKGVKAFKKCSLFYNAVKELNIECRESTGNVKYFFIEGEPLFNEFKKRNLILPEEEAKANEIIVQDKKKEKKDKKEDKENKESSSEEKKLRKENEELKKKLEEMEKRLKEIEEASKKQEVKPEIKKEVVEGKRMISVKVKSS